MQRLISVSRGRRFRLLFSLEHELADKKTRSQGSGILFLQTFNTTQSAKLGLQMRNIFNSWSTSILRSSEELQFHNIRPTTQCSSIVISQRFLAVIPRMFSRRVCWFLLSSYLSRIPVLADPSRKNTLRYSYLDAVTCYDMGLSYCGPMFVSHL